MIMSHLPYLISAYGITLLTVLALLLTTYRRFHQAKNKLDIMKKLSHET